MSNNAMRQLWLDLVSRMSHDVYLLLRPEPAVILGLLQLAPLLHHLRHVDSDNTGSLVT